MKSRYLGADKASAHGQSRKIGVLLTNLGTPDAPTAPALRSYLREFLSDPRVVEIPRLVWMIILHGIILRVRPAKSAALYKSIWTEQGSPLMVISKAIKDKVSQLIDRDNKPEVIVDLAMRYGNPSIANKLEEFRQQGVDKLIVMPLYPQYGGPTTASTYDAINKSISSWRWVPSLQFINGYHDEPLYVEALANSIQEHIGQHGQPDKLVLSYHGMPRHFLDSGDPYFCFCQQTTRLVAERLSLPEDSFISTFQSRFGKAEWLKPYTDETLESLAKEGYKHVAIISPAFSADCLETLEELAEENREIFEEAGGETYHYIAALNDRDDHCRAITQVLNRHLACYEK